MTYNPPTRHYNIYVNTAETGDDTIYVEREGDDGGIQEHTQCNVLNILHN